MTIKTKNPLPRYVSGKKSLTEGQGQNNIPLPQNLSAGKNNKDILVNNITKINESKNKSI